VWLPREGGFRVSAGSGGSGSASAGAVATARERLEAFVLAPAEAPAPAVEVLERAHLAAFAYTVRKPPDAALFGAFVRSTAAHASAKSALAPLIAKWHEAGIETLLFKGFALAEYTYAHPGQRFCDDVDVLIRPEQGVEAGRIARQLGWSVLRSEESSGDRDLHEVLLLLSPDRSLAVDVHRRIIHSFVPWHAAQRRVTEQAWARSRPASLEGTPVRRLEPRDDVLIGLVMNRCWSRDRWRLKSRDYVDMSVIVERGGVTLEALRERARELRCARTFDLFLERCDPFARRLDLRAPTWRDRWRWGFRIVGERRAFEFDRALRLMLGAPRILASMLRELPGVLRVLWLMRREPDVTRLFARLDERSAASWRPLDPQRRFALFRGVTLTLQVLRVRPDGACLPRALAIYAALRRLGQPAEFVSGVRAAGGRVEGHAWVELDGSVLPELEDVQGVRYEPNLRHPARGGSPERAES
jgi:hypothetical protein